MSINAKRVRSSSHIGVPNDAFVVGRWVLLQPVNPIKHTSIVLPGLTVVAAHRGAMGRVVRTDQSSNVMVKLKSDGLTYWIERQWMTALHDDVANRIADGANADSPIAAAAAAPYDITERVQMAAIHERARSAFDHAAADAPEYMTIIPCAAASNAPRAAIVLNGIVLFADHKCQPMDAFTLPRMERSLCVDTQRALRAVMADYVRFMAADRPARQPSPPPPPLAVGDFVRTCDPPSPASAMYFHPLWTSIMSADCGKIGIVTALDGECNVRVKVCFDAHTWAPQWLTRVPAYLVPDDTVAELRMFANPPAIGATVRIRATPPSQMDIAPVWHPRMNQYCGQFGTVTRIQSNGYAVLNGSHGMSDYTWTIRWLEPAFASSSSSSSFASSSSSSMVSQPTGADLPLVPPPPQPTSPYIVITAEPRAETATVEAAATVEAKPSPSTAKPTPTCPICGDFLVDPLSFGGCAHHVCEECGNELVARALAAHGEQVACPICRYSAAALTPAAEYRQQLAFFYADERAAALAERAAERDPAVGVQRLADAARAPVQLRHTRALGTRTIAAVARALAAFYSGTPTSSTSLDVSWRAFLRGTARGVTALCFEQEPHADYALFTYHEWGARRECHVRVGARHNFLFFFASSDGEQGAADTDEFALVTV